MKHRVCLAVFAAVLLSACQAFAVTGSAVMLSPVPGSTFTSSSVTFSWSAGSATAYWLLIGSSPRSSNIYNSSQTQALSATVNNIPTDGRAIYVTYVNPLTFEMVGPGQGYNDVLFTRDAGRVRHVDEFTS